MTILVWRNPKMYIHGVRWLHVFVGIFFAVFLVALPLSLAFRSCYLGQAYNCYALLYVSALGLPYFSFLFVLLLNVWTDWS